jgi:hypothetical protein
MAGTREEAGMWHGGRDVAWREGRGMEGGMWHGGKDAAWRDMAREREGSGMRRVSKGEINK